MTDLTNLKGKQTLLPCRVHGYHWPPPTSNELHHVFPLYMGGEERGEKVVICPTGHENVHRYLKWMVRGMIGIAPKVTRAERALAVRAHEAWLVAGRPTIKTLEEDS